MQSEAAASVEQSVVVAEAETVEQNDYTVEPVEMLESEAATKKEAESAAAD